MKTDVARFAVPLSLVFLALLACNIPSDVTLHVGKDCVSPPPLIPIDSTNFSPLCPYRKIDPVTGDTVTVFPELPKA